MFHQQFMFRNSFFLGKFWGPSSQGRWAKSLIQTFRVLAEKKSRKVVTRRGPGPITRRRKLVAKETRWILKNHRVEQTKTFNLRNIWGWLWKKWWGEFGSSKVMSWICGEGLVLVWKICISILVLKRIWLVFSEAQMFKRWQFSPPRNDQMSNGLGFEHLPGINNKLILLRLSW